MSTLLKSFLTGTLLTVGLAVTSVGQASAATMTATLTADNHYGLFTGSKDASKLNFVGRNEGGYAGSSGGYNWSQAETFKNFNIDSGDYIYAVIWDDAAVAESWIGEFTLPDNTKLLTDPSQWEYVVAKGLNPNKRANKTLAEGDVPPIAELVTEIVGANWIGAKAVGFNGVGPWGTIAGISNQASFLNVSNTGSQNYTIFRTKGAAFQSVPEPTATLGLLAFGAMSAGSLVKRKSQLA